MRRLIGNITLLFSLFLFTQQVQGQVCGAMIDTSDLIYHPYEIYSVVASKTGKNEVVFTIRAVRDIEFCGLTAEDLNGLHAHHVAGGCAISDTSFFYETYRFEKEVPVSQLPEGATRLLPDRHLAQFMKIISEKGFKTVAFQDFNQAMREMHQGVLSARNEGRVITHKRKSGHTH